MSSNFEILDSITESMAIINASGEIVFTNRAWRRFSEENMGKDSCTGAPNNYLKICESVEGEESQMGSNANAGIKKVINGELKLFELEYPCHSPTEDRWFILRASPVSTDAELTLLAHINITNRKNAELEVEKNYIQSLDLNNRLNTTLYKIVHDIQNPLHGIMGLADLSKSESDTQTLNTYLGLIEKGSSDLSTFLQETLQHISATNETQLLYVHMLAAEYKETIEHLLKTNSIDLQFDIEQTGEFKTNAIEFRSILSNLIGNAIKYCDHTKDDKFILVKFSSDSKSGTLRIQDNGVGIKKDDIPKLMQRNFQVNQVSSTGIGLGLFMIEKSTFQLGGSIRINSEFGVGSEFVVEIPNAL